MFGQRNRIKFRIPSSLAVLHGNLSLETTHVSSIWRCPPSFCPPVHSAGVGPRRHQSWLELGRFQGKDGEKTFRKSSEKPLTVSDGPLTGMDWRDRAQGHDFDGKAAIRSQDVPQLTEKSEDFKSGERGSDRCILPHGE
eukprot:159631-Amorphochlora_amoeboformis.AAC.1